MNKGYKGKSTCYAKGGPVVTSNSQFLKTPDTFRTDKQRSDYAGGKGPSAKDKSLAPVKPQK